jgi:thiamine-phosphate pyrophosphorylase
MPGSCLLCYITDRRQFAGDEAKRRQCVLQKIVEAARAGVDFVQLREKDLTTRDLENLAREAVGVIRGAQGTPADPPRTRLLINSRVDVALAVGADGVHLRSDDISVADLRAIWDEACARNPKLEIRNWIIGVSCHTEADVRRAASAHADFVLFAPVFGKKDAPASQATGLTALRQACGYDVRVLALGGVTLENARSCLQAGAAGIAAIRLFQENDIAEVVQSLRGELR